MQNLAPIVLFVYNRPSHTLQTIEALKKNELAGDSELFVFCDGPKSEAGLSKVQEVHKIVDAITGFKNVVVKKAVLNKGLANSVISGVSEIVQKYGKVIVLEDDLVTSPYFLQFMNDGLEFYENDDRVISIHGYVYPLKTKLENNFFLRGADCWGWATWKRGWKLFNPDGLELLMQLKKKKLEKVFDFDGCYFYTKMLEDQITGKNNSWAIRWYASAFLANKLTLYPKETLVHNIGFDDSGTHCGDSYEYKQDISSERNNLADIAVVQDEKAREIIKLYFNPRKNFLTKIKDKIARKIAKKKLKKERKKYGWFSTDLNWQEILRNVGGYDSDKIAEKCKNSLLKVKEGEAAYERDSVLFKKAEYSWPLLSGLFFAALQNNDSLDLIDFGGSFGSSYYQNKNFLSVLKNIKWRIVEQKNFVEIGKKYFESDDLKFYYDMSSALDSGASKVLLLSSVLQYLEHPFQFISEIKKYKFDFIIIDRTGFIDNVSDVLTIQKVPPEIYEASYPCWFFNKHDFLAQILDCYEMLAEFESPFDSNIFIDHKIRADYSGFLLRIKK